MHKLYTMTPADRLVAVTKSDTTVYDPPLDAIWVGGTGNIAIVAPGSEESAVTIVNVQDGTVLPIRASKVMSTNTTATNIVGLYHGKKQGT